MAGAVVGELPARRAVNKRREVGKRYQGPRRSLKNSEGPVSLESWRKRLRKKIFGSAIKLHYSSRIFYFSIRIGKHGRPFRFYKLRSMKRDAPKSRENIYAEKAGIAIRDSNDPRITKIGKLLRRTHLDESPQFFNFLNGDLNLVGFRPIIREEYKKLPEDIKKMYDELGPGLVPVHYACDPFPPTDEQMFQEYRDFYKMWKKDKTRASIEYMTRLLKNKALGKAKTV